MAKRSDPFTVIVEQDEEGYFVANVPELRGCHTQAKSLDTLMKRVAEAITLCLAEGPRPRVERLSAFNGCRWPDAPSPTAHGQGTHPRLREKRASPSSVPKAAIIASGIPMAASRRFLCTPVKPSVQVCPVKSCATAYSPRSNSERSFNREPYRISVASASHAGFGTPLRNITWMQSALRVSRG